MKNVARMIFAALLFTFVLSTASLADGGAPMPTCVPPNCSSIDGPAR